MTPLPQPRGSLADLRLGRWQEALADVSEVDCVLTDPPYSARTHDGQCHGRRTETIATGQFVSSRGLGYTSLSPEGARDFVRHWSPRCRGWLCVFTDSELAGDFRAEMGAQGRTTFAPIACVQKGMNVRLAGDGPSSWTTWLIVSRPKALNRWGTLPGAYVGNPFDPGQNTATAFRRSSVVGSKPLWLMRALVRDYTRPGDLVCDPCAGGATTLLAASMEGRRSVGSEMDPATFEKARRRLANGYTPDLFGAAPPAGPGAP